MKRITLTLSLLAMTSMLIISPADAQNVNVPIVNSAGDTLTVPMTEELTGEVLAAVAAKKIFKKAKKSIKKKAKSGTLLGSKKLFPSKGCNAMRVVTYNVGTFTKSGYNKMNTVADMMSEIKADIVCVNELDSCTTRTGGTYQLKDFAEALGGWNYNFTGAIPYQGGSYGIGMAANPKYKVLDQWGLKLSKGKGAEQRGLSVMEFDKFVIACTHLDHKSDAAQLTQVKEITDAIDTRYHSSHKPVILCGDMNAVPGSKAIKELKKNWTLLSETGKTFSSSNPTKCIDYIFIFNNGSKYKVKHTAVGTAFNKGDVKEASDHLPVYVDIVAK